jgi:hypothetical protein
MTFSPGLPWFLAFAAVLFFAATFTVRPLFMPVRHRVRLMGLLAAVPIIFMLAGGTVVCAHQTFSGATNDVDMCSPKVAFLMTPAWAIGLASR